MSQVPFRISPILSPWLPPWRLWPAPRHYTITGPGVHDEQLTAEMYFALRRVEVARRLEYMAEARGRPRPGQPHPDAEEEDHDGALGGANVDSDVDFEKEDALPGCDSDDGDGAAEAAQPDVDMKYEPKWRVHDDELHDVVHRESDAQRWVKSKHAHGKRELMQTFLRDHRQAYASLSERRSIARIAPLLHCHSRVEKEHALKAQEALRNERSADAGHAKAAAAAPALSVPIDREAAARLLMADELPLSPLEAAVELIATSGVWRSKEQCVCADHCWRATAPRSSRSTGLRASVRPSCGMRDGTWRHSSFCSRCSSSGRQLCATAS